MGYRRHQLRVKIKSLASEARIIRQEAQRTNSATARLDLHLHRINVVRKEARAALLAYAFLRRKPYGSVERYTHEPPDWARVKRIAQRFAYPACTPAAFDFAWRIWHSAAQCYLGADTTTDESVVCWGDFAHYWDNPHYRGHEWISTTTTA